VSIGYYKALLGRNSELLVQRGGTAHGALFFARRSSRVHVTFCTLVACRLKAGLRTAMRRDDGGAGLKLLCSLRSLGVQEIKLLRVGEVKTTPSKRRQRSQVYQIAPAGGIKTKAEGGMQKDTKRLKAELRTEICRGGGGARSKLRLGGSLSLP
jgi:hypothetical protein